MIGNVYRDDELFWEHRLKTVGHTGRLDRKAYIFDQLCRLHAFETWLETKNLKPGKALDFGCGIGDFARLLNRKRWDVVGYDKFIEPKYQASSFMFVRSIDEKAFAKHFDLLLSVTTLDHILNDIEFMDDLRRLRKVLSPVGRFFFLECSPAVEVKRSSYQAFRSIDVWMCSLETAGFSVTEIIPFFDPVNAPVAAWSIYERALITKIGTRLEKTNFLRHASLLLLNRAARRSLITRPYQPPTVSSINIIAGQVV